MEKEKLRIWLICTLIISLIAITAYYMYFFKNEATITDGTLVKNNEKEVVMMYE
jgi:flagellar basal body-associated protein FliL